MREETATKVMVIAGFTVLAITIALIISLLSRPVPATAVAGGPLGLDEYSITSQSAARTAAAQNAKYERDLAARKAQAARAARAAERKKLEDARKAQKKKQASVVTSNKKTASRPAPVAAKGSVWDRLAKCESGGRWNYNGSSGYDGGLQFLPSTWRSYKPSGYPSYAWQASREQQIVVAEKVLSDAGWGAWPACARKLGLR
jgi:Transglycosylase-like domain